MEIIKISEEQANEMLHYYRIIGDFITRDFSLDKKSVIKKWKEKGFIKEENSLEKARGQFNYLIRRTGFEKEDLEKLADYYEAHITKLENRINNLRQEIDKDVSY